MALCFNVSNIKTGHQRHELSVFPTPPFLGMPSSVESRSLKLQMQTKAADQRYDPKESRYVQRKGLSLHSHSKDGIGTLNPILGRGLDS